MATITNEHPVNATTIRVSDLLMDLPRGLGQNYYLDEAGDPNLFDRHKRVRVGQEGCSKFFMLGLLATPEPAALQRDIEDLRAEVLADPYFRKVPSLQPNRRKTALTFHAKDDPPEIRRDMFKLLRRHSLKFLAIVKDKTALVDEVRGRNAADPGYRYNPGMLYDSLVMRLCHRQLHKSDTCHVWFAKRGVSDRTRALKHALRATQECYRRRRGLENVADLEVYDRYPHEHAGLQAVDYFLWAVQRLYETNEDRYLEYVWPHVRLIIDADDQRGGCAGVHYQQKRPLFGAALSDRGLGGVLSDPHTA